ncbi:MAG TPA: hypothetical protein VEI95_18490, partial [Acidobacteriota bacterium]|nr:hypothetical protein [Acidobacteriota bacterium]
QENEIKKEMKNHFSWVPATCPDDDRIELFVGLVKEVVKTLDPRRIQISEYSHRDDTICYGTLDSRAIDTLIERCAIYFSPEQIASIHQFVETHRTGCDVMAVVLRRQRTVEQFAL